MASNEQRNTGDVRVGGNGHAGQDGFEPALADTRTDYEKSARASAEVFERSDLSDYEAEAYPHERDVYPRRSTPGLLRQLMSDVAVLFRKELALAATEINRSVDEAKTGVTSMAAGGAVLYAGLLFLLYAAVLALAIVLPGWAASLIVGAATLLIGWIMLAVGKNRLKPQAFAPDRTVESLRKDREAIRRQIQ